MKAVVVERFGPPTEVARCVERPDPAPPGPGELRLRVLRANINPADLLLVSGRYGDLPRLPAVPGSECAARVEAVGPGVDGFAPGDLAMPMGTSCWREIIVAKAQSVVRLPGDIDPAQAAMIKANPATALAMLEDIVELRPGDWVAQNAANSAVGRCVTRLARARGLKVAAVVRRGGLDAALRADGADAVVVDDGAEPTAAAGWLHDASGGARIALALDAVGGRATGVLAAALGKGGTLVNYGLLSGEPCSVAPHDLVFRDIRVRGFWLARWFRGASPDRVRRLYADIVARVSDGTLAMPVAAVYPFARVGEALAHAARDGRNGKIQLEPG
jgi:NADPH:quinone reductase-like Zn-dependent oxidoreductase